MPADPRVLTASGLLGARDPAQPLVTLRVAEGRVELSGSTVANWAAKTANLLVDGYGSPARVGLLAPLHWQTVCLLIGAAAAGAEVVVGRDAGDVDGCDLVLGTVDRLDGARADDVLALSTHPLGAPPTDVPPGVGDYAREVPSYDDVWSGPQPPPASIRVGGAAPDAPADAVTAEDRVLLSTDVATPSGLGLLLAVLRSGAALVLVPRPDELDLSAVAAEERVTAVAGVDVDGLRRLA